MHKSFGFFTPTILFGVDAADQLSDIVRKYNAAHVLLVSDRGLEKAGMVDKLSTILTNSGIKVESYTDVEPEPSAECARACTAFAKSVTCDLVMGLGGGSSMDTAKTVAMLLGNGGDILDYLGANRVPRKGLPLIQIPTTAGTGSEVGKGALFYIPERKAKESIFSDMLLADLALIDPVLTVSAPPAVTAASGIDALCHAIESYTSRSATPLSQTQAEQGIRLISRWLTQAVANGQDIAAREGMALGSMYASLSLANATSHAVHALAYPLQGYNRIIHGLANGVLLPFVLDAIVDAAQVSFARIAGWMGEDLCGMTSAEEAQACVSAVRRLSKAISLPQSISALGVQANQVERFTQDAFAIRRLMDNCPKDLSLDDVRQIFQKAL